MLLDRVRSRLSRGTSPLVPVFAAAALAGCGNEGDRLAQQYEILKENRASRAELCAHARRAADAYLQSSDKEKFARWRRLGASDCAPPKAAAEGAVAAPAAVPAAPESGIVTGALTYPSDHLPEDLTVCARDLDGGKTYCGADAGMKKADSTYSLRLPAGRYHVWARTGEMPGTKAYYSEFVTCGANVECRSHAPIAVQVAAGATRKGVDPGDWYDY